MLFGITGSKSLGYWPRLGELPPDDRCQQVRTDTLVCCPRTTPLTVLGLFPDVGAEVATAVDSLTPSRRLLVSSKKDARRWPMGTFITVTQFHHCEFGGGGQRFAAITNGPRSAIWIDSARQSLVQ